MLQLDRRRALALGLLGAAVPLIPALGAAGGGFTHDVASGEPGQRSVLLWTRYVSRGGQARLRAEVSAHEDFHRIAGGGDADASAERDHTARLTVTGLEPDRWYFYRFVAPDGTISPVGRTRTLPEGACARFAMGVFSCSNLPFGFFNAYGHAAAQTDLDLMVHLGDYFYEYDRKHYPDPGEALASRVIEPATEVVHLADYRQRFASYRRDPDLLRLHNRFPMIAMWDDHESANDSWKGGAENHNPATEGDWDVRKRASVQAYREWMPVSDADWAEYRIGDLATLFRPEERLRNRTHQVPLVDTYLSARADPAKAIATFRDNVWMDPSHTLFGSIEDSWFADRMRASAKAARWQVLAQQVNVGITRMPPNALGWVPADKTGARAYVAAGIAAAKAGMPFNMDSWNGYPEARSRMLRNGLDADANLVVLSGDSHNAWAFDLIEDGHPAGIEFGGQSVTSPGFEASLPGTDPATVVRGMIEWSPELRWADTAQRGYMAVELTPERAACEWRFMRTIRQRTIALAGTHRESVVPGARQLST